MKNCLVLGGNGFIGKNFIKKYNNIYSISSFDRYHYGESVYGVEYIEGNFSDDSLLANMVKDKDIIINLISTSNPRSSIESSYSLYNIDILQTVKLLEYTKNTNNKILFSSSGGTVYGDSKSLPIAECEKLNPMTHYAISKVTIENLINMYNLKYGKKNIVLRIANPYGKGQDYKKGVGIIDSIIRKALNEETITIWGNGDNIRDYIYIDDLCDAIFKLCEYNGDEKIFNVGSGVGTSINELVFLASKCLKKKLNVLYLPSNSNDVKDVFLNIERLKKETGFEPKTSIEEGVEKYLKYLKEFM